MAQNKQRSSKNIPTLNNQHTDDDIDQSCPICFETFDNDQHKQMFTPCDHSFCKICLEKIIQLKPFCPLCRKHLQQKKSNNQSCEQQELDPNTPWNVQTVRAFFSPEFTNKEGSRMRRVHLSNGEATNIHVSPGVKINISPGSNIVINGKRVQNPSDCNQQ